MLKLDEGPKDYQSVIVRPRDLRKKEHGAVLCYPGTDLSSFESRVKQLRKLEVQNLILEGDSKVGKYGIVGRGCVSTVVKAKIKSERDIVALKIRRVDANRSDMMKDFELQTYANSFGVGPKAISVSKDLFAMEFIESTKLGKWFQALKTRISKKYTRALIRNVLTQCCLLDMNGLDHGELSNPTKHVLIWKSVKPYTTIIDYESASRDRKISNVTAVAQFFFLGGWQSAKVRKILGLDKSFSKEEYINELRRYKASPSRNSLDELLALVKC